MTATMRSVGNASRAAGWAFLGFLLLAGCNKDEQPSTSESDAGAVDGGKVALDPELAQAMAAASVGTPGVPSPAAEGGPPANGIFAAGRADKEATKGSAPRIDLGSEGEGPKLSFSPAHPAPGTKLPGTIQITVQQGQQGGGLPIEFALTLEGQKPKEGEAPAGSVKMVAKVTGATIPVTGAGKDVEGVVGKLKGARVEYVVSPEGAGSGYKVDTPKAVPPDLAIWLETLRDTLALATVPMPSKPVGAGAYWMVTSREGVLGLDLVSYRMVKVEAIKDGVATLSVNTKRYAASRTLDLAGLPPEIPKEMSEFQSMSEARLEYKPGTGFPLGGDTSNTLAIGLGAAPAPAGPKQKGQQQGLMIQSRAVLQMGK